MWLAAAERNREWEREREREKAIGERELRLCERGKECNLVEMSKRIKERRKDDRKPKGIKVKMTWRTWCGRARLEQTLHCAMSVPTSGRVTDIERSPLDATRRRLPDSGARSAGFRHAQQRYRKERETLDCLDFLFFLFSPWCVRVCKTAAPSVYPPAPLPLREFLSSSSLHLLPLAATAAAVTRTGLIGSAAGEGAEKIFDRVPKGGRKGSLRFAPTQQQQQRRRKKEIYGWKGKKRRKKRKTTTTTTTTTTTKRGADFDKSSTKACFALSFLSFDMCDRRASGLFIHHRWTVQHPKDECVKMRRKRPSTWPALLCPLLSPNSSIQKDFNEYEKSFLGVPTGNAVYISTGRGIINICKNRNNREGREHFLYSFLPPSLPHIRSRKNCDGSQSASN